MVVINGGNGGARVIRGRTDAEHDFSLTQAPVDTVVGGGTLVNHNAQLTAGVPVTYVSCKTAIATVDSTGFVQWVSDGTVTIVATAKHSRKTIDVAVSQESLTIFGGTSVPFNLQPQSVL